MDSNKKREYQTPMEWGKEVSIGQAGFTRLRLISTAKLCRDAQDYLDKKTL